jgi:hypothetical protein
VTCRKAVEAEQDQRRYWTDEDRRQSQIARQQRRREDPVVYAGILAAKRANRKPVKRDNLDRLYHNEYEKRRRRGAPRVTVDRRKQVAA